MPSSVTSRVVAEQRLDLVQLALAADERGGLLRQVVRNLAAPAASARRCARRDRPSRCRAAPRTARRARPTSNSSTGVGHALDHPVAVRLRPCRPVSPRASRASGVSRVWPPRASDITRAAVGLARPSTSSGLAPRATSAGAVLAQDHRPHVQAGARLQRHRQRGQRPVVGQRVAHRIGRRVEQQQHAVGLVDLAPAPVRQQVARHAVVRRPDLGHRRVAEALGQLGAVDHVGQQQRAQFSHSVPGESVRSSTCANPKVRCSGIAWPPRGQGPPPRHSPGTCRSAAAQQCSSAAVQQCSSNATRHL